MGSGKTAVGKCLARLLDYPFRDTDHEIEQRTGADISLIFEREGEAGFRVREREVVAELSALERIVLATGGGAIVHPETRRDLSQRGWVVYLETAVHQQALRAGRTRHRPMLYGADPEQRLGELGRGIAGVQVDPSDEHVGPLLGQALDEPEHAAVPWQQFAGVFH